MRWIGIISCSLILLNACAVSPEIPLIKDPTLTLRKAEPQVTCEVYRVAIESQNLGRPDDINGPVAVAECMGYLQDDEIPSYPRPRKPKMGDKGKKPVSFSLSEIEFDEDFTNARLTLGWYCGSLCGGVKGLSLVRKDRVWVTTSNETLIVF